MKIVHFHFGKDGGAERFFVNLVNSFHERGVEQKIVIRPNRAWRAELHPSVEVFEGVFRRLSLSRFFLRARVNRLVASFKPDALISWMPRASRLMPPHSGLIKIARLGDYPLKLEYFTNIDVIVCNTPGIAERVKELGWKRRIETISNFTKMRPCAPIDRDRMQTPPDAFVFLGMGRFVKRKGFDTLIKALSQLDGAYLWLVGAGEERENLVELATRLGVVNRLRIVGWQNDPSPYLAACDVFCMPSRHEPLGNVILEAWGMGKPVVSTKSEGPMWMMRDGVDGLLVQIGDADGFAEALGRLRVDPVLAATIVAGGKRTLSTRFSKSSITDAYLKLCSDSANLGQLYETHSVG